MSVHVLHDFLQENENGFVLTLYLSRRSDVEFAEDLGRLETQEDDCSVYSYIQSHHPKTPINHVRVVTGEGEVKTLSFMSMMAHKFTEKKHRES